MEQKWMDFPQVVDVFEEAVALARADGSSVVSEWHLLLSLLRFDSVWRQFDHHEALQRVLFRQGKQSSDGKGAEVPELPPELRDAFCVEAEQLRAEAGEAVPTPEHFVQALFIAGSDRLRAVMNRHCYKGDRASSRAEHEEIQNHQEKAMSDKKTLVDKVMAGEVSIDQCDLNKDFSLEDLDKLLTHKIIRADDLPQSKASDLLIAGVLSYEDYPLEHLAHCYQIQQLKAHRCGRDEFKHKVNLTGYSSREWLKLLGDCRCLEEEAPWEKIRMKATADEWAEAIISYPYLMKFADTDRLVRECLPEKLRQVLDAVEGYVDMAKRVEAELEMEKWAKMSPLKPENDLEEALMQEDCPRIVEAVIGEQCLKRPDALVTAEFFRLPEAVAVFVLQDGLQDGLWQRSEEFWHRHPVATAKLKKLIVDADADVTEGVEYTEKMLMGAILKHADEDIRWMIQKKAIRLRFSPYLMDVMKELPCLEKQTVVTLFHGGLLPGIQPLFLNFLMAECKEPKMLEKLSYKQRLMYANLMIHVMMGQIAPEDESLIEEDWYPMGNSVVDGAESSVYCHAYNYYYDPRHVYEPRHADDDDYEKPSRTIRRKE